MEYAFPDYINVKLVWAAFESSHRMIFVFLCDLFTGWWNRLLQRKGQCKWGFFLLPLICSPFILAPANTQVTLRHGPVISFFYCTLCRLYHLHSPFPFSFSYSPYSYLFFHSGFLSLLQPLAYNPTLFSLFSRLFFQNCILSPIPPPTLSQVERFLPCFSSNWRMRCMSWLHCCFIRKQLFAPFPSPLAFFSLSTSLPHSLSTLYSFFPYSISSRLSSYISVSTALIDANWWMHGRCYKSPKWGTDNGCFLLLLLSENEKKERYH